MNSLFLNKMHWKQNPLNLSVLNLIMFGLEYLQIDNFDNPTEPSLLITPYIRIKRAYPPWLCGSRVPHWTVHKQRCLKTVMTTRCVNPM